MRTALGLMLLVVGCGAPPPARDCAKVELVPTAMGGIDELDLLFVIGDSNSMLDEQAALQAEIGRLVTVLTTGDYDGDGDGPGDGELADPDFEPIRSLHLAVTSADLGTYGNVVPNCVGTGDDGVVMRSAADSGSCAEREPGFLSFDPASDSEQDFVEHARCSVSLGNEGCGFVQPLEAMLRAVSPSAATEYTAVGYEPPSPVGGGAFQADGLNDGFRRENAFLSVVLLTDEDDCSPADTALYDLAGPYASVGLNFLCVGNPDALVPVGRYVDGLLQAVRTPGLLSFVAITGMPVGATVAGTLPDYAAILGHPDMQVRAREGSPQFVGLACDAPDLDWQAQPGRRIVHVARQLELAGATVGLGSICEEGFGGALEVLFDPLRRELGTDVCLGAREIVLEPDGSLDCEVSVVMYDEAGCAALPGSSPRLVDGVPVREGDAVICDVTQRVPASRAPGSAPPEGPGWYYDDFSDARHCVARDGTPNRIVLDPAAPLASWVRLECDLGTLPQQCEADVDCELYEGSSCIDGSCRDPLCD